MDRRVGQAKILVANRPLVVTFAHAEQRHGRMFVEIPHRVDVADDVEEVFVSRAEVVREGHPLPDRRREGSPESGLDLADLLEPATDVGKGNPSPTLAILSDQPPALLHALGTRRA